VTSWDDYKVPTLVLDSEDLSLLRTCVALVLGEIVERDVSNIIKRKSGKLEELYSKLDFTAEERSK
jgi:hypothetical protein